MCDQDIKSPVPQELKPEPGGPAFHFFFRILKASGMIAHGASQAQNADSIVNVDFVINADAAVRWNLMVFIVMVAVHILSREIGPTRKDREVLRMQVAAGNDEVNSCKFTLMIMIPQISRFFICNCKYPHSLLFSFFIPP